MLHAMLWFQIRSEVQACDHTSLSLLALPAMAAAMNVYDATDVTIFWDIVSNGSVTMLMPHAGGLHAPLGVVQDFAVEIEDVTNAYLAAGVSENVLLNKQEFIDLLDQVVLAVDKRHRDGRGQTLHGSVVRAGCGEASVGSALCDSLEGNPSDRTDAPQAEAPDAHQTAHGVFDTTHSTDDFLSQPIGFEFGEMPPLFPVVGAVEPTQVRLLQSFGLYNARIPLEQQLSFLDLLLPLEGMHILALQHHLQTSWGAYTATLSSRVAGGLDEHDFHE